LLTGGVATETTTGARSVAGFLLINRNDFNDHYAFISAVHQRVYFHL